MTGPTLTRRNLLLGAFAQEPPLFRAEASLVEIHAAVLDRHGRHVTGLTQADFQVADAGVSVRPQFFESEASPFSLGLLLDVTGSMEETLPVLKRAALQLLEQLRADDEVAVFVFSDRMRMASDFSPDRKATATAIRRLQSGGKTALFDALARTAQKLATRKGKKALIAFTDGNDNSSVLTIGSAVKRAKREAIQLYTIAQGDALRSGKLMDTLEEVSRGTGGRSFKVKKPAEMEEVFGEIARDLRSSYLLGYAPKPGSGEWRPIQVTVPGRKEVAVRCREGYFAP
jgi:Ca-activated chloride channel family protein